MSETNTNKANISITTYGNGHKISLESPPTRKLSEEDISTMIPLIENLLQDSLVYCTESCCEDAVEESSVEELASLVIKTLFQEYIFPTKDVQELLDQNLVFQKKIVSLQNEVKILQGNESVRKASFKERTSPKHSQFGPIHKESKNK